MDGQHLHILWTNADPVVFDKMVLMYAVNSLVRGWWEKVTVILWGVTARLAAADPAVRERIVLAMEQGVKFSACITCAKELGVEQALRDMGYDFTYGICDAPSGMLHQFADLYGVDASRIYGECYGLNPLSYFQSIKVDGKEIMPELIANDEAYAKTDMRFFEKRLLEDRGCVLNEYLYYFYYREKAVANILNAKQTRGEMICDINRHMTEELSKIDIENDFEAGLKCFEKWYGIRENNYMANETGIHRDKPWTFDVYSKDAGGYAGVALKFIEIAASGGMGTMILCAPNGNAIEGLEPTDIIEVTCDISREGCKPHHIENIPESNLEMIRRVKYYERLAARGIVNRSRKDITECLTMHPLVGSYSLASKLTDEYIKLNAPYIGDWRD